MPKISGMKSRLTLSLVNDRSGRRATLERGNHPKKRPLTGTVTLKQSVEITYLKILTLMTQCKRGREERVQESAMIRNSKAFDPQRSADNTARVKQ